MNNMMTKNMFDLEPGIHRNYEPPYMPGTAIRFLSIHQTSKINQRFSEGSNPPIKF